MVVLFGILQILTLVVLLALVYRPLGDYMARMFTTSKDLRVERGFYRVIGVDSDSEQSWRLYLRSVLIFSLVGVLLLYAMQRLQAVLPYSLGFPAIPEGLSFNTAASFVANTNWQSYSPDVTMGYAVQLGGLVVQNFLSVAVGIAVAIALIRGLAYRKSGTVGNFWVDLTRSSLRLLLPLSFIAAIILIAGGVIQNFNGSTPSPPSPAVHSRFPVARLLRKKRSSCLATTAVGSTTRIRRIHLRIPPPGRTCSRSSSCLRFRSHSPAPLARWSEISARAPRSSR